LHEVSGHLDDERRDHMSPVERFGCGAVLISSMTEISDMSEPFISELESLCEQWAKTLPGGTAVSWPVMAGGIKAGQSVAVHLESRTPHPSDS
jgi:hypothetical protein